MKRFSVGASPVFACRPTGAQIDSVDFVRAYIQRHHPAGTGGPTTARWSSRYGEMELNVPATSTAFLRSARADLPRR
jgi:hypothetical protein